MAAIITKTITGLFEGILKIEFASKQLPKIGKFGLLERARF
jgi:hypothetical protein